MPIASVVAEGYSFLESPRWRDDTLYVSDFYTHQILAVDRHGQVTPVAEVPGQPSGLGFLPDGEMLAVSMTDRRLLRLQGRKVIASIDLTPLAGFHCNDMLVDDLGRAYVGNFGWDPTPDAPLQSTNLILVSTEGEIRVAADNLVFPNGMVMTQDRSTLLVAETFAARISAFDIAPDGSLGDRRIWADFATQQHASIRAALDSGDILPDGLALDADGAVWVGDAGGRGAVRVAKGGTLLDRVEAPGLSVYAVALGGEDRRTLFMCAASALMTDDPSTTRNAKLLKAQIDVRGVGLP